MTPFHLFEVFGIELEYMIVKKADLQVAPLADQVFYRRNGTWDGEADNGIVSWSNELVSHVIELKTTKPSASLSGLSFRFQENIAEINRLLLPDQCCLMPTACHPWMNPLRETRIWPHDQHEIYELYNRIFDCRGHGWSNVQSTHLNLPFCGNQEFDRLHTAIRLLLPSLPALCASSPILDGQHTGFHDSRMYHYQYNQKEIPIITGKVIPEYLQSQDAYQHRIFDPIKAQLRPYDKNQILDQHFVNSRGAIARFDRGAIEIRVMDIQECPTADLGIIELVVEVLKALVQEEWVTYEAQARWHEDELYRIFQNAIKGGEGAQIENVKYSEVLCPDHTARMTFQELWESLYQQVQHRLSTSSQTVLEHILQSGTLATRILRALQGDFSVNNISRVYRALVQCLADGVCFDPEAHIPD